MIVFRDIRIRQCWRFLRLIVSALSVLVTLCLSFGTVVGLWKVFQMWHAGEIPFRYWVGIEACASVMLLVGVSQLLFSIGVLRRGGRSSNKSLEATAGRSVESP